MLCYTGTMTKRYPPKRFACAWCGDSKVIAEMRNPESTKGKAPSTCYQCRESNPGEWWCDFHEKPHHRSAFTSTPSRNMKHSNVCKLAASHRISQRRNLPDITCVSCRKNLGSWNYRGGKQKSPTCRDCEEINAGKRWCLDCGDWVDHSEFNRTGVDGKFWTVRCRLCRSAHRHGVTVKLLLERQGSAKPECAACGSEHALKVDHDHSCCAHANGCPNCVRGYLCHECNTAEGLIKTAERALKLAAYIERVTGSRTAEA